MTSSENLKKNDLFQAVRPYAHADYFSAFWQLFGTVALYVPLVYLLLWSYEVSYWLTLLLIIPAAGVSQRFFVIQHDCVHGSFLPKKWQNDVLGSLLSLYTFSPYSYWAKQHDIHHQTAGDLSRRGTGDVITWTVAEYESANWLQKIQYRIYRNPIFLMFIAAPLHFIVLQRVPLGPQGKTWKGWSSTMSTNIGIAVFLFALVSLIGPTRTLLIYAPILFINCCLSVWLFYVQHQFDGTYWRRSGEWQFRNAALGSSFYDLPKFLHWCTANIGYHHIHHLNANIPNYKLARCYQKNPSLKPGATLGIRESFGAAWLALWDEDAGKLIRFSALQKN